MCQQSEWYEDDGGFFGPQYLLEYRNVLTSEKTRSEVNFLHDVLGLKRDMSVIDVACGHGRHTLELARLGCEVVGVDINTYFLAIARQAAERKGIAVTYIRDDIRQLRFAGRFDVAVSIFNSIGYFETDEDDQRVFDGVARTLNPRGQFLIDVINRNAVLSNFRGHERRELPNGSSLLIDRSYDPETKRNTDRRTLVSAGATRTLKSQTHRLYSSDELAMMAARSGLTHARSFGDFNGSDLTTSSPRTIMIFNKS